MIMAVFFMKVSFFPCLVLGSIIHNFFKLELLTWRLIFMGCYNVPKPKKIYYGLHFRKNSG